MRARAIPAVPAGQPPLTRSLRCATPARRRVQEAAGKLRAVREEAAVRQEQFEKEVGMAQRMAQLYREAKEERAAKCTELEGVVQELKTHMEVGRGGWGGG